MRPCFGSRFELLGTLALSVACAFFTQLREPWGKRGGQQCVGRRQRRLDERERGARAPARTEARAWGAGGSNVSAAGNSGSAGMPSDAGGEDADAARSGASKNPSQAYREGTA